MNRDQALKYYTHTENEGFSGNIDIPKDFYCKLKHSVKLKFTSGVQWKKQVDNISYEIT